MGKDARNKSIFFGSWTGTAVEPTAAATKTGTNITAVSVDAGDFATKVGNASGTYVFTYDGTGTTWKLNGSTVTITQYGITVTGSPSNGDTVTVVFTAGNGGWEALGKDLDDLSKDLNPDTENSKNVLGETTFEHKGYQASVALDTYYMAPERLMYEHLLEVAQKELYAESDIGGYFAEAYFTAVDETNHQMTGYAYVRRANIVPQSTGGSTAGFSIPFTVYPVGGMEKKAITYDMLTNTATMSTWSDD